MADLNITASEVKAGTNAQVFNGTAGVTISAGDICYLDVATTPNTLKLADADISVVEATVKGIALNDAFVDQPVELQVNGTITLGASSLVAKGTPYILSGAEGKMAPAEDRAAGCFITIIGVGNGSSGLEMDIFNSGIQI